MQVTPLARRVFALTMSMVILIGSIGISADFHICQDTVKSFSFFGEAEKCSDMEYASFCKKTDNTEVSRKKCCSNESVYSQASFQSETGNISSLSFSEKPTTYLSCIQTPVLVCPETRWSPYCNTPHIRQHVSLVIAYQNFLI